MVKTAERVSTEAGDNYVFQRSRLAYLRASELISGDILEIGTGTGYGVEILHSSAEKLITIDKEIPARRTIYENVEYLKMEVPPIELQGDMFDYVVSFQVIEHIKDDLGFVNEVSRVLHNGGKFIVTTPNAPMSLTRNPWHVREYDCDQLKNLLSTSFSDVEVYLVVGNDKVMDYYEKNKASVRKFTRFDILDLQHRLPRKILQIPYDILNRINRNKLLKENTDLTLSIELDDYSIVPYSKEDAMRAFDLFVVATK